MSLSSFLMPGGASGMTSFFSIEYMFVFLPIAIALYWLSPQKIRRYVLIFESCAFFWLISGKLIVYLIISAASIYGFGLWLDRINLKKKEALHGLDREEKKKIKKQFTGRLRLVLALATVIHIGALLVLKYSAFAAGNINSLLALMNVGVRMSIPRFIMPIGISFFTLQAVSYLVDVYRGKNQADRNFFRVFLWLSFFPQIVEGPICRYSQTAQQLWKAERVKFDSLTLGLQRIIFGMMKKMVVADRLNLPVENVFNNYSEYHGGVIAFAAVCYTIQLYMDFSGSMDAVIGTAQIFGIEMPENFKRPFFSKTISEFWKRWHITLGEWLKDYVFYPITMSKPMQKLTKSARKSLGNHFGPLLAGSVALFCVWFANGLWHGAAWNFIVWGLFFAILLIIEKLWLLKPLKKSKVLSHIYVMFFVIISFVIFNAADMKEAFSYIGGMFGAGGIPFISEEWLYYLRSYGVVLIVAIIGATPLVKKLVLSVKKKSTGEKIMNIAEPIMLVALLLVITAYLVDGSFNPFLYFRF